MLEQLGVELEVVVPNVPEEPIPGATPADEAVRIAEEKAQAVVESKPQQWVLAADTMVILDGAIIGKPRDESDAIRMLGKLAGNWHTVITGWCIINIHEGVWRVGSAQSRVLIKPLDEAHIRKYVETGEPLDKAGAYAVQGVGAFMVSRIEGSYTNVVGLPLTEVVEALEELGALRLAPHDGNDS